MYVSPYLAPLHLSADDATRCKFVFTTKGITDKDDNYRGKMRYRFNRWQPVSPSMPILHSAGMVFSANQEDNLTGMASVFDIPWNANGSINFLFEPPVLKQFDIAAGDVFEMGVGFLKYTSTYWGLAQACEFLCTRRIGAGDSRRHYWSLNNIEIPSMSGSWDASKHAGFTLWFAPTAMSIVYAEYTDDGIATYSDSRTLPLTNVDKQSYKVVWFMNVSSKAHVDMTLVRTYIDVKGVTLSPTEVIYFRDQPNDYIPPLAPIRDSGLHLYNPPHSALVEDATITIGSDTVSREWWGILKFLSTAAPETCIFTDPDGIDFRVCFQDLTARAANLVSQKVTGYDLTMAVMVPH